MATLLPPNWHVDQTGTTMTVATLAGKSPPLRQGLMLQGAWHGPVFAARLIDQDGTEAARGRLTLIDGWALHDTIVVAKSYRRQGLGSAIMAALANQAQASGVRRGLLNATVAGRALYQRLGWTARAPWTTAQIAR
ncbi:MAG: hypothetical protein B7Y47_08450 [Sphingomonas sp. 28-63-12]|nr:MAG: hypothetical protein B7Y47_08450 [Sphingomonas sp. 28-63-12]